MMEFRNFYEPEVHSHNKLPPVYVNVVKSPQYNIEEDIYY